MALPFLAAAGARGGGEAGRGLRRILRDKPAKLFSHIWDDGKRAFERQAFWGVGNGWAAAGMTRVIRALPDSMASDRKRIVGYVREVLDGCLKHRRPDGLFHDVVDDPKSFVETNLSQMLSYTIFRGVKGTWLPKSYLKDAEIMRNAAHAGRRTGQVRDVCGSPTRKTRNRDGRSGSSSLMEAAARILKPSSH
jgi:rhamnogalacturonyl hydrolase YesR